MNFISMLLSTSTWAQGKAESFKLLPLTKDCPYIEAFFDPFAQTMVITSVNTLDQFTTLERLDDLGEKLRDKNGKTKVDRIRVANNKQFFIDKPEEIAHFVNTVAFNADTYDFAKYLTGTIIVPDVVPAKEVEQQLATADLS
jgi:hypothetical protein